jgi:hypothetical protein
LASTLHRKRVLNVIDVQDFFVLFIFSKSLFHRV